MAGTLKRVLLQDLRDVEGYLEKTEETRENALTCGILRVLYHLLEAEIRRMEQDERR